MVLDYCDISPNPARDRIKVKLPRRGAPELEPPTAEHVEAVARLLPANYRLALLALDATGVRVNERALTRVADVDEAQQRWLIRASIAKTRRPPGQHYPRCSGSRSSRRCRPATTATPSNSCSASLTPGYAWPSPVPAAPPPCQASAHTTSDAAVSASCTRPA